VSELEIKAKLQRALHTSIGWAEWQHLKRTRIIDEYERGELGTDEEENWRALKDLVQERSKWLRDFRNDLAREQSGDVGPELGEEPLTEIPSSPPPIRDERTFERALALGTLDRLRSGGTAEKRPSISGSLFPRGGVDGTKPHWVFVMAVELWVPPEEVKEAYRSVQKAMLAEPKLPRTQTRAFKVAQFVWQNEIVHGKRPPWPVLWERWNNSPFGQAAGTFNSWRDLHRYFLRGAKATPPCYVATDEQLTELVRLGSHQGAFDKWASEVRN